MRKAAFVRQGARLGVRWQVLEMWMYQGLGSWLACRAGSDCEHLPFVEAVAHAHICTYAELSIGVSASPPVTGN